MQNIISPSKDSGRTAHKLTVRPVQGSAAGHTVPDLEPGWIFHPSPDGSNQNVLVLLHGCGDTAGKPPLALCNTCCANRGLQMGLSSAHSLAHDKFQARLLLPFSKLQQHAIWSVCRWLCQVGPEAAAAPDSHFGYHRLTASAWHRKRQGLVS